MYRSLRSMLTSIIDMNNIDIYLCLGPIECGKKDLAIRNDNDVKWVYHIITSNVERHIALIVHSVGPLSICLGSSSSSSFQTQIHDDGAGSELSTPKDIVHFIRAEHGLSISYQKVWRAREAALDDIRGSLEDFYKMLPRFAYILELNNPGYVIEYKVDADGRFLYFFMALSASIFGWEHYRPVISIDGTSMKNKYSGGRNDVVIVSDRHKSICKAIEVVFPNILHCICLVHVLQNLKLKYKRIVNTVFHSCGKAFNIVDFEHEMHLLESSATGIREKIESIGFAKSSRTYSSRRRYNAMTTNISKSLNSDMLKARELPICSMLEILRMMLQRWFFERRNEADYQVTDFTKTIEGILREHIELSRSMKV
ncbi:protein FAR1-RELATED SEQUENCE 3-like [Cucumis melo var. makuwa]|uniref:Protein FAR1-RELATED SEQUENCE 3-like n=1 Tax=Cucumis melo var. makuwa TaxID=1194695 RepID=A0A5D3DG45_CUCMM|nr:protein FAR1-RELATED SEQUENCE 3-like [Cucumis melo var. makuwa]